MQEYINELFNKTKGKFKAACIFGSVANGYSNENSDIDMLLYREKLHGFISKEYTCNGKKVDVHIVSNSTDIKILERYFSEKIIPLYNEEFLRKEEKRVKTYIIEETCKEISRQFYHKKVNLDSKSLLSYYIVKLLFKESPQVVNKFIERKFNTGYIDLIEECYMKVIEPMNTPYFDLECNKNELTIIPKKKGKKKCFAKDFLSLCIEKISNPETQWRMYAYKVVKGILTRKNKYIRIKESDSEVQLESLI